VPVSVTWNGGEEKRKRAERERERVVKRRYEYKINSSSFPFTK
jgi:hypothetical protein